MGQWLIEPLPPAAGANIQPELHIHRPIAHEKRVGGSQKHSVFHLAPARCIERAQCTALHQPQIFTAQLNGSHLLALVHLALFQCPAKIARRLHQLVGHARRIIIIVKAIAFLAQHFAKKLGKKLVQRNQMCAGAIGIHPVAQPVEPFARGKSNALLHIANQFTKAAQVYARPTRRIDNATEQMGAHWVQPVDRLHQRHGHVAGRRPDAPIRVGQSGQS